MTTGILELSTVTRVSVVIPRHMIVIIMMMILMIMMTMTLLTISWWVEARTWDSGQHQLLEEQTNILLEHLVSCSYAEAEENRKTCWGCTSTWNKKKVSKTIFF